MSKNQIIRLTATPDGFSNVPDDLDVEMFESALPIQHSHDFYADDDIGLYIGVWDTTDMVEASGKYPCDEFMLLIEGNAAIKNTSSGLIETVKAGEAFIIPRGYDCQWQQQGYLRKFYVIYENINQQSSDRRQQSFKKPLHDGIILVDPQKSATTLYNDASGKFSCGIWDVKNLRDALISSNSNIFAFIIEGELTLIDDKMNRHQFLCNEVFFIPRGVACSMDSSVNTKLCYVALEQ